MLLKTIDQLLHLFDLIVLKINDFLHARVFSPVDSPQLDLLIFQEELEQIRLHVDSSLFVILLILVDFHRAVERIGGLRQLQRLRLRPLLGVVL